MVDALIKIRELLKPDGLLIDIHPEDTILPIFVQAGSVVTQVGEIDVESKFAKYRLADEAIDLVVEEELYTVDQQEIVDFVIYFDSVAECRQYLAEEWRDAKLSDSSWKQMAKLMTQPSETKQIFYSEGVKFCSLSPVDLD